MGVRDRVNSDYYVDGLAEAIMKAAAPSGQPFIKWEFH